MKAGCEMRTIGVSLGVAGAALWLALAGGGVAGAAAPGCGTGPEPVAGHPGGRDPDAAEPACGPERCAAREGHQRGQPPVDGLASRDVPPAGRDRQEQAKMLHDRMKVPPPLPPSEPEPPMTRLDIPLPLWPANVNLSVSMGEPSVSFSVGAEVGCPPVAHPTRWRRPTWPARIGGPWRTRWRSARALARIPARMARRPRRRRRLAGASFDIFQVSTAFGYNSQREFSVGMGYDFVKTPEKFSKDSRLPLEWRPGSRPRWSCTG